MMPEEIGSDMLAISSLNTLEYCPRYFFYESVLGEARENACTMEAGLRYSASDTRQRTIDDGVTPLRRVWVWSDRLCLSGFADVVEEQDGYLRPVEYKQGKGGQWLNDQVQLCAQALCLEEMLATHIQYGFIFYLGSAHREEVIFTKELRADSVVLNIINRRRLFTTKDFQEELGGAVFLKPEARKTFYARFEERLQEEIQHPYFGYRTTYRRCIELQARLLGKWLTGEIPAYLPLTVR